MNIECKKTRLWTERHSSVTHLQSGKEFFSYLQTSGFKVFPGKENSGDCRPGVDFTYAHKVPHRVKMRHSFFMIENVNRDTLDRYVSPGGADQDLDFIFITFTSAVDRGDLPQRIGPES